MKILTPEVEFHLDIMGDIHSSSVPIVLLHGFTGNHHVWDRFRSQIDRSTVAIDLPGHGQSQFLDIDLSYNFDRWVANFEYLIDSLNLKTIHLLGYSMGGRLALMYAVRYPHKVSSLILESANPGITAKPLRDIRNQSDFALSVKITDDFEGFIRLWESNPLFKGQSLHSVEWEKLQKIRRQNIPQGLANSLRSLSVGKQPDLWKELNHLDLPVLVITGAKDKKYTDIGSKLEKKTKNCQWESIDNSGHTPHMEQFDIFLGHIREWLSIRNTNG